MAVKLAVYLVYGRQQTTSSHHSSMCVASKRWELTVGRETSPREHRPHLGTELAADSSPFPNPPEPCQVSLKSGVTFQLRLAS